MLTATILDRVFTYTHNNQTITMADPDRSFNVEAVKDFYSNTYPLLVTATIDGPYIEDDQERYSFNGKLGTKG